MKATKPSLSTVLGDPLNSPTVAGCAPTQRRSYVTTAAARPAEDTVSLMRLEDPNARRPAQAETQELVTVLEKPSPIRSKERAPKLAVGVTPARFSSPSAVITMSASSIRRNSWGRESIREGLVLSPATNGAPHSARDSQNIVRQPRIDMSWLVPVLTFSRVPISNDRRLPARSGQISYRSGVVRDMSFLLMVDFLYTMVRLGSPWVVLVLRRAARRWKRGECGFTTLLDDQLTIPREIVQMSSKQRRSTHSHGLRSSLRAPRGIRNYGQTCFLNSVLQALASLHPFLLYLDRIVQLHLEQREYGSVEGKDSFSERLYSFLQSLNQSSFSQSDPREILYRVSQENKQFGPHHGLGFASVGKEQHDAQELMQALLGLVMDDARLTSGCSLESSFLSSAASIDSREDSADNYISLSGLLMKMDLEQKESQMPGVRGQHINDAEKPPGFTYSREDSDAGLEPLREEKKQEYHEQNSNENPSHEKDVFPLLLDIDYPLKTKAPTTADRMLQSLSSISPSPLTGWFGSTIQCCACNHIRPIRNQPFLDIALTPTSVSSRGKTASSRLPPCTIIECLREYVSEECVKDVDCNMCTIQQEVDLLEDETLMLRGAISTLLRRARRKSNLDCVGGQAEGLKIELMKAESRLEQLRNTNPDTVDDPKAARNSIEETIFVDQITPKMSVRGPAKRCEFLTRLPPILCLHIQRKFFDETTQRTTKTLQHVEFPERLDMAPYCAYGGSTMNGTLSVAGSGSSLLARNTGSKTSSPIYYRLQAVVEHRGNATSGHYQSYRRFGSPCDVEKWFLISDEIVAPVTWRQVRRCQAYLLFYEAI